MADIPTRKSAHRRRLDASASEVTTSVRARQGGGALSEESSLVRRRLLEILSRVALLGSFGAWGLAGLFAILAILVAFGFLQAPPLTSGDIGFELFPTPLHTIGQVAAPTRTPTPLPPPQVAIVAGHWSHEDAQGVTTIHDSGALCDDGLREVTINKGVADRVVALLQARGYRVDLLEEFDAHLKYDNPDYAPAVFLSIHSDSCVHGPDYPMATGYKIAHAEPSDVPEEDDRLVACLRRDYEAVVHPYNLIFNENTITTDMTEYHGFREIVNTTPAAIIELGFMYNDRVVLTRHQDELARGLANGLDHFLKNDRCGLPTATSTPSPSP